MRDSLDTFHRPVSLLRGLLVAAALAGVFATPGLAVVRTVDDDPGADFSTIQAAITVSSNGDVVQVACGTYVENIVMKNGVDVLGAGADCTFIDGNAAGTVVTFSGVGSTTDLSGFTIRNGLSSQGGGIFVSGNSSPTISHNVIRDNMAVLNMSGYFGYGGGISVYNSAPVISNNLLVGNSAERTGGGVDMYFGYPEVVNNTIIGNTAIRPGAEAGYGGGIYSLFSDPTVTSNIIYDNDSEGGGGGLDLVQSSYTVEYNNLFQNFPLDWSCGGCSSPLFPPPPGNIQQDPALEAVGTMAPRYCPRSNSPVIDAGPLAAPVATMDLLGRPRVQDGNFDGTSTVDMGSCESDEVTRLQVLASGLLLWDPTTNVSASYNLYRGDLDVFLASCATDCVYTQDTLSVVEARQFCGLPSVSHLDLDVPAFNQGYFYLVTGEDLVEGRLGWVGSVVRDNDNPCP